MISSKLFWVFSLLFSTLGLSQSLPQDKCPPLSADVNQRIENYLAQRLVSARSVRPSVRSVETLPDSCYRKVTMTIPGTNGDVIMYLSPNERFLTSTLYDLSKDPQKEVARIASNVADLLMHDPSPQFAGSKSRVTLVEFVDFQCPYCKHFAEWYSNLPETLRAQTTLVFKNLPLPQHPWARSAALYAACANMQSPVAFHEMVDLFFQKQPEIMPDNLQNKILTTSRQSRSFNLEKLNTCVSMQIVSSIIDRDIAVAKQLNVNNTPTLFVNGRRVTHVTSADELQQLLETELSNLRPMQARSGDNQPEAATKGDLQ